MDLKTAKRWLVARNLMATGEDPDCLDIQDPDVATEMIVESSRVINRVTELAEKWQALALEPFEVDTKIVPWIIQVTKVKTELRMMLSMFKAAESIRQGEKDPLQWILEEVQASKMEEWWKETMTPKSLILLEKESVAKPKPKSQVRKAWEEYKAAEAEAEMAKRQLEEKAKKN